MPEALGREDKQSHSRRWSVICDLWNTDHRAQSTFIPLRVIIRQRFRQQLGSGIIGAMIGVMLGSNICYDCHCGGSEGYSGSQGDWVEHLLEV